MENLKEISVKKRGESGLLRKFAMKAETLALFIFVLSLTSCDKDDDPEPQQVESKDYIYVLSSGDYRSNNSALTIYNIEDGVATTDYFLNQNQKGLGNTAQDIIVYGSKIYISVYGESRIEVTDLDAKLIKTIVTDGQPRYLASEGGKVYATYFNGYVARIDTASLTVETKIAVGRNPEQLAAANGKLYVANSGGMDYATPGVGYDKTVSVIDIATFKEIKKLEVEINPCNVLVDNQENIYVVSIGDYGMTPNTVQKINSQTDAITVLDVQGTYLTMLDNILYMIHAEWVSEGETWVQKAQYKSYNVLTNTVVSGNFIGNAVFSADPYQIASDEMSGEIYILTSDYEHTGDVYIFDKELQQTTGFEAGLNPIKAVRIRK